MSRANCGARDCACIITTDGDFTVAGDGQLGTPFVLADPTALLEGIPIRGLPKFVKTVDGEDVVLSTVEQVVLETAVHVPIPNVGYQIRVDWDAEAIFPLAPNDLWSFRIEIGTTSQFAQRSGFWVSPTSSRGESFLAAEVVPSSCMVPIRVYATGIAGPFPSPTLARQQMLIRGWFGSPGAEACPPFTADDAIRTSDQDVYTADMVCFHYGIV